MRRLLTIAIVAIAAATVGLVDSSPSEASGYVITTYVYHPTGSDPAYLRCGWHSNCDGNPNEADKFGLDLTPCAGCSETTGLRLIAYGGLSTNTWVARAPSYDSPALGCPYAIVTDLRRIADNALFGRVINLHSDAAGSPYSNIYSKTAGQATYAVLGSFVNELADPCSSYNHTMQWYASGLYDGSSSKNTSTAIPNESGCGGPWAGCNMRYGVWTTHEYYFWFNS